LRKEISLALADFCRIDTSATREDLMMALSEATLIFPIAPPSEAGNMQLAFTSDEMGRPLLPGFTDRAHVLTWLPQGTDIAAASASGFLPALLSGPFVGLVINSKSETSVFVSREVIQMLVDGHLPSFSEADAELIQRW
jgi:hypothetical protein